MADSKDFFYIKIWQNHHVNYPDKLKALAFLCAPCAHCGCQPVVGHNDYEGDYYCGDKFNIECPECEIGLGPDDWDIVLAKWNRRTH